jgi:hypothetical protein
MNTLRSRIPIVFALALAACGVSDPTPSLAHESAAITSCSGGDTTNLYAADDFDYTQQGEHTLLTPSFTLYVCTDHFPIGSAARAEVELAIQLYNNVAGTSAYIAVGTAPHKTIQQLFPNSPTRSFFDVVDNSTVGFPCHAAGDTSGWAMNTCRHEQSGSWGGAANPVDAFVISVNATAYTFDTDPTSTDYPKFANIAHEIGHAFGMNHTADWTDATSHVLLSTMQGNLPILPPHDRGYLRSFYPGNTGSSLNLVASPKVRLPSTSTAGYSNYDFAAVNPTHLYLSGGIYYNCATGALPVLQAQWLNQGQIETSCRVKNRFRIGPAGPEDSASKVTVKAWEAAQMPAASQDRIAASVTITDTDLASLSMGVAYELTFMVDRDLAYTESIETDNVVTSTVTLHQRGIDCPPTPILNSDPEFIDFLSEDTYPVVDTYGDDTYPKH